MTISISLLRLMALVLFFTLAAQALISQTEPQNPSPPSVNCVSCDTPYTAHTYLFTTRSGCYIEVHYKKRHCASNGTYDLVVESISIKGGTCDSIPGRYLFSEALRAIVGSNLPGFPPFDTTSPPVRWRVMRPACVTQQDSVYQSCGDSCCVVIHEVRRTNCGQMFSTRRSNSPRTTCPNTSETPLGCAYNCDEKYLTEEDWYSKPNE